MTYYILCLMAGLMALSLFSWLAAKSREKLFFGVAAAASALFCLASMAGIWGAMA